MGVIGAVAATAETAAYASLPILTRNCDYTPVTTVALTLVAVRFVMYALLANPWWYILADSLKGR